MSDDPTGRHRPRPWTTGPQRRLAALVAVVGLLVAACAEGDDPMSARSDDSPRAAAPLEFSALQLSGEEFDGAELRGTDTVLWFWAPWCTSCRAEAPDVVEAARAFAGEVEVLGVPGRGGTTEMEGFVEDTGTGGLRHVVDSDGSIWRSFGVIGQPAFAFIGDDGTAEVFVGGLGLEQLSERMAQLASS